MAFISCTVYNMPYLLIIGLWLHSFYCSFCSLSLNIGLYVLFSFICCSVFSIQHCTVIISIFCYWYHQLHMPCNVLLYLSFMLSGFGYIHEVYQTTWCQVQSRTKHLQHELFLHYFHTMQAGMMFIKFCTNLFAPSLGQFQKDKHLFCLNKNWHKYQMAITY